MDVYAVCEFWVYGNTQNLAMGSALLFIVRDQREQNASCSVNYGCMYFLAALMLVGVDVMVMSSA